MVTVTDPEVYRTLGEKVVKTLAIPGQAGKQIKVESWGISLANKTKGVKTTATTYMKYSDKKFAVAGWGADDTDYTSSTYDKYSYSGDTGKDVILQWELKTENSKSAALMKNASVTYSYVDVGETPVEEAPVEKTPTEANDEYIVVKCKESETDAVVTKIKEIAPDAGISTLSKYSK